jgi:uncharacterized protein
VYQFLADTFTNFLSGLGVPGRDKMTAHRFIKQVWTRDQLEAAYQSDWIARKAICIPAQDATREWRSWQAEQDQIELIEETEDRLRVQLKLQEALIKARLYGGACLLIGVDGNMASELDPETIGKDGLKFLHVLCPHQLVIQDLIKDIASPYYGQPEYYELHDDSGKWGSVKIHPSRMVRLLGLDPPDPMKNYGWGDPLMQTINDAVAAAGTVAQSIAAMISEAKFDVVKIPGLTEIFATTDGTDRLIKRFTEANVAKSVINAVVLDGEEEWQRIGVDFNGMPEVLNQYLQIASGACDIPMTRFLGMSPGGLNSTGESDLQNYYDKIKSDQELRLMPALEKLDIAIQRSALGKFDENIFYEWNSLWQMSDTEKAAIAKQKADAAQVDANSGLIPFEALVKGRCNQLVEDGTYPGLETAIEEAIKNEELMNEEELATQMAMEHQQQKMLPAPGERGMEGQDPNAQKGPPSKKKKKEAAPVGDSRTFCVRVNGYTFTFDELNRAGVLEKAASIGLITKDAMRQWNEEQHSRVEGGQEAGQFGSGTGTPSEKTAAKGKRAAQVLSQTPKSILARAQAAGRTMAEQREFEIAQGMARPRDPAAGVLSPAEKRQRNLERQQAINARSLTAQGQAEEKAAAEEAKAMEAEAAKPAKKVATADDFDKAGIPFSGERAEQFLQKWNDKIGMDPAEFKQRFTGGMQDVVDMRITLNGDEFTINGNIYETPEMYGDKIGNFTRDIKPDKKEAYSALFEIEKDAQKSDIGKKILAGNIEVYEALGITKVKVTANIDVGGYAWAKYGYVPTQSAWEHLSAELEEKLDNMSEGRGSRGSSEADDWNSLSEDAQDSTKRYWQNDARSDFMDSEITSWRESGQPLNDAKIFLSEEFKDKTIPPAWVENAIQKARDRIANEQKHTGKGDSAIPFSSSEIYDALTMEDYSSRHDDGSDDFEFSWDDEKLNQAPLGEAEQGQLPGMEQERSETLSDRMRRYLEVEMQKASNDQAEKEADNIEPPDHLTDNVDEYMDDHWEQMSDDERLQLAIRYDQAEIESDDEETDLSGEEDNPEIAELLDLVRESNPKNIWKVSDTELGKKILLKSGWSGVLDLKDPESYSRFKRYISKGKK